MAASYTNFSISGISARFHSTIVPISSRQSRNWSPATRAQPFCQTVSRSIRCSANTNLPNPTLKTCRNCKKQFDPLQNNPRACCYHTAHFGGETKRKFESVYTGGTMNTPDSGTILQYWHCCGSEDPFNPGCVAAPHSSYDD